MEHCQQTEMKFSIDSRSEADGLDSLYVKLEYYRSLEYSLNWERPMHLRRHSRVQQGSEKSPKTKCTPDEEAIQHRLGNKRQRTGLLRTISGDGVVNTDRTGCDIIDLINNTHETENGAKEDEGAFIEVADKGVDESDDDCASVSSSLASGPSLSYHDRFSQDRCSACQKLYQKVRRTKAPIKNKLLDNDPKSLTSDQWTLIKKRRPTRMPNAEGNLLIYIHLITKRLVKQRDQCFGWWQSCSRPHIYLNRNLRRCIKVPLKQERKMNRRKRMRDDSQGCRVAKQQRLQSDVCMRRGPANTQSAMYEDYGKINQSNADVAVEFNPSPVTLEITKSTELPPNKKTPKKMRGFKDLLNQLRGNSSMIVRETR